MKKSRVIVGMSGGVDSSVAAALLKEQGHEVIGVFMKNWSGAISPDGQECSWRQDREDAMRVAAQLEIPLLTWDFEKKYRKNVFQYFLREYKSGRTPNPDVLCNQFIKFDTFLTAARKQGADFVATGHYARVTHGANGARLYRGKDASKDQSYFLCRLTKQQLKCVLFPLGDMKKTEVRTSAKKLRLATEDKKDSQGICFVGDVDLRDFLSMYVKPTPGDIVDENGGVIGRHQGLPFYTIGQRHGAASGTEQPMYVASKNSKNNTLHVVHGNDNPALFKKNFTATHARWVAGKAPQKVFRCKIQVRYRQEPQPASVAVQGSRVQIHASQPQRAVTPGQFVAFYKGAELLGSAVLI